jgi:hypothetical protein
MDSESEGVTVVCIIIVCELIKINGKIKQRKRLLCQLTESGKLVGAASALLWEKTTKDKEKYTDILYYINKKILEI